MDLEMKRSRKMTNIMQIEPMKKAVTIIIKFYACFPIVWNGRKVFVQYECLVIHLAFMQYAINMGRPKAANALSHKLHAGKPFHKNEQMVDLE